MSIRDTVTPEQKAVLRKIKTVSDAVKVAVYDGCNNQPVAAQFHEDVRTYGLWEALLYVESYEGSNHMVEGTAQKAMLAAIGEEGKIDGNIECLRDGSLRPSELSHGWPGEGSGEDDLADMNANEADDYRDE